jgi:hypothetical protein
MVDKALIKKLDLKPTRDGIHVLRANKQRADWMEWKDPRPRKPFTMQYRVFVSDHDQHGDPLSPYDVCLVAVTNVPDNKTAYYSVVHPVPMLLNGDTNFLYNTVREVLESGLAKTVENYLSRN